MKKVTKLEMVEAIVKMVDVTTEEAQRIIINAVSEWGLQKSENFVELLVAGDLEKASKRATMAELQEIVEFIEYYNADSVDAPEDYEEHRKINSFEVKKQQVGIQIKVAEYNREVVSYEDGDNYVPSHMQQQIAEEAYRGFESLLRDWVLDNSKKIAHYSGTDLFPKSVLTVVQIVGGKYGVGEFTLSQLAKLKLDAQNDLFRLAEVE